MLCRLFRFMISSAADSDSSVNRWARRHVTRCVACRQFLQSCRTIDVRLRSEADEWQQALEHLSPATLACSPGVRSSGHGLRVRTALAAACLAVTTAILFLLSVPARPPQASGPAAPAFIPGGAPWATQWVALIPNPLATEAEHLTGDAESGIRFIVACLDVHPLATGVTPRPGGSPIPPQ